MKKIILLSFLVCNTLFTFSQQSVATFETWHNVNIPLGSMVTIPNGWNGSDSIASSFGSTLNPGAVFQKQILQDMPGNSGSASAMKVISKNQPAITGFIAAGTFPAIAANAKMNFDIVTGGFAFQGGLDFIDNPISASFWIKNNPLLGDSTQVSILAIDNSDGGDSIVAVIDTMFGATISNFTKITMPFQYANNGFNTTVLRVLVASSGNFSTDTLTSAFTNLHDGSYIVIDDVEVIAPSGIVNLTKTKKVIDVYPTTVNTQLHITKLDANPYQIRVQDLKGNIIFTKSLQHMNEDVDVSQMATGQYIYSVREGNNIVQTGKFNKR